MMLAATGTPSDPLFAGVFEPEKPVPLTKYGIDEQTLQLINAEQRAGGQILRWAASYGSAASPCFAGIWGPNSDNTAWNNDGLTEDPNAYQARFDAETSAWCRPAFVTLSADNSYLSLFVANQVGAWQARHNLTPSEYQSMFDTLTADGYFPVCVQAAGSDAASAKIAALFARQTATVAKQFAATGPVANAQIDQVVREVMESYPATKQAALAIVHGTKLVYARGYTLAEPGWPTAEPTTYFRLASVSKTITALAVYQLIEAGKLALSDTLQSILDLRTPSGGQPTDPEFGKITIQQLLEHMSGLDTDSFDDGFDVVAAYEAAGKSASVPVTQEMTDSYIATLKLVSPPGKTQAYSNCGYYLLGHVVTHLRGASSPVSAYQAHLLSPLGVSRVRSAIDLLAYQYPDEARYQAASTDGAPADLIVDQSQQTAARPLVPAGYGDDALAIAQGSGGLSAAVTDVARLVAIVLDQKDNPALKRTTLVDMLTAATTLNKTQSRAGYGLDGAGNLAGGSFWGQKGGNVQNAASVFSFNGDWGFVALWGNLPPNSNPSWYSSFPDVMNIAQAADWGDSDLFPTYGMKSL